MADPAQAVHWWNSLSVRLAVLFVIVLGLVLASLGTIQYLSLRANLITVQTRYLTGIVGSEEHSPILVSSALGRSTRVLPSALLCRASSIPNQNAINRFAQLILAAGEPAVSIGILGPAGQLRGAAPPGQSPPQAATLLAAAKHATVPVSVVAPALHQLLVADPVYSPRTGRLCAVVEITVSMTQINQLLLRQVKDLVAEGLLALIVGALLTLVMTATALRPLRRLEATARMVASGDLTARSPVPGRHDEVWSLATAFNHMTEQLEKLFHDQEMRAAAIRQLTANISHELRTPLTSIRGYLDILQRGAAKDETTVNRAVEHMHRHAQRMSMILNNLLQLARIDARREQQETASLNDAVSTVISLAPAELAQLAVLDLYPAAIWVRASASELQSVVQNLFDNASKYATGSMQHWKTHIQDNYAVLEVTDEGPGITSTDQPHILERFYRGTTQAGTAQEGTGLGLSIVAAVARASGGDVEVRSPGPGGKGSLFQISFGLAPDQNPAPGKDTHGADTG